MNMCTIWEEDPRGAPSEGNPGAPVWGPSALGVYNALGEQDVLLSPGLQQRPAQSRGSSQIGVHWPQCCTSSSEGICRSLWSLWAWWASVAKEESCRSAPCAWSGGQLDLGPQCPPSTVYFCSELSESDPQELSGHPGSAPLVPPEIPEQKAQSHQEDTSDHMY